MSRKKKNGNQDQPAKLWILATAIIQLISAVVSLIDKLIDRLIE